MSLLKRFLAVAAGGGAGENANVLVAVTGERGFDASSEHGAIVAAAKEHCAGGRYGEALRIIANALDADSENRDLLFARASVLWTWDRQIEAFAVFRNLDAASPWQAEQHVQLGWSYLRFGNLLEAERSMRNAVLSGPNERVSHFGLAAVLQAQERLEDAAESLERALTLAPADVDTHLALGNCRLGQGNATTAEACFRDALALDGDSGVAWGYLGMCA